MKLQRRQPARCPPGGLDPIHLGHADVHEHEVRPQFAGSSDGLSTGSCFTDDREVGFPVDGDAQGVPEQGLVIDQEQAHTGSR